MNKEKSPAKSRDKKVRKKKEPEISMEKSLEVYQKSLMDDVLPSDSNTDSDTAMRKKRKTAEARTGPVSDRSPEKAPTTKKRKTEVREEEEEELPTREKLCADMYKFMQFTMSRLNDIRQQSAESVLELAEQKEVNSSMSEEISTLKKQLKRANSKRTKEETKERRNEKKILRHTIRNWKKSSMVVRKNLVKIMVMKNICKRTC